jgi:CTP synthase
LNLLALGDLPRLCQPSYRSTKSHPEDPTTPNRAHPLFAGLVGAALERQRSERLVEVERHRAATDAGRAAAEPAQGERDDEYASVSASASTGDSPDAG